MITYFIVNNDLNVSVKDLDNAASTKNPTALFNIRSYSIKQWRIEYKLKHISEKGLSPISNWNCIMSTKKIRLKRKAIGLN